MITQELSPVTGVRQLADTVFVCSVRSPRIASEVKPGQFVNILIEQTTDPLLRRPFSVYRVDGDRIEIIFNVVGRGTALMSHKGPGDTLDILGPLGVPYSFLDESFSTALLVAGGLGVAPMPLSTGFLKSRGKKVVTFLGARTASAVLPHHLENLQVATDDGTMGFRGNVVELLGSVWKSHTYVKPKIFACGPTAMLRGLAAFAVKQDIPCEVSLEGPMACGIGICQGCPVELVGEEKKFALMCKDGPTFDVRKIRF